MAKGNKAAAAATQGAATQVQAAVATVLAQQGPQYRPVPGVVNVLKPNATFRGARQAWFNVLVAHNGQPANAFLAACAATPPSLPASGRAEAPTGWLSWFVRNGYCTVTTVPAAAPAPQA